VSALYVTALGRVDEEALGAIEICLWQAFGFEIQRMSPRGEPEFAYDVQRKQYSSVLVLRELLGRIPTEAFRVLAVTEKDLFIPMLSFVFGQAQVNGSAAVVSLARLRQEFYGLPPNRTLFLARSMKEAVHEMGHTFGLTHCMDSACPMSLSNAIAQVDRKGTELCRNCSIILEDNTKHIRTGNGAGEKE
jgi:archaemetzincin